MGKWQVLIAAAVLSVPASAAVSLTGVVGDDMCSGDHKHMGGTDAAKCTAECIGEMGGKYALIVSSNGASEAYVLSDQAAAAKFAGKKVTAVGDVATTGTGKTAVKTLTVKSMAPAK